MTLEVVSEIENRISARRLGIKLEPLLAESPTFQLDVEDAFLEDNSSEHTPAKKSLQNQTFDSEPE